MTMTTWRNFRCNKIDTPLACPIDYQNMCRDKSAYPNFLPTCPGALRSLRFERRSIIEQFL